MKDKKKLIVLIVMLLMPVAGIWYFIKMSLKYMKGAEIEIFFPNNFFKQFGVWSIIWIILWIVIMFIERKYKVKKIKERKKSIKILQCIVMFVMAVISFWIYVSILTGKKIKMRGNGLIPSHLFLLYRKVRLWLLSKRKIAHIKVGRANR